MRNAIFTLVVSLIAGLAVAQQPAPVKPVAPTAKLSAQEKIKQAMSAAPATIANGAAIMDWPDTPNGPMKELRKGTNGWTCMPSSPENFGGASVEDPMCLDKQFMAWADAWMGKKDPHVTATGIAYMLRGDKGASNTDPFATARTPTNQWIVSPAHVMVVPPNAAELEGIPTDPHNGGPWVMWKGTKYAHIMVPVAAMPKS